MYTYSAIPIMIPYAPQSSSSTSSTSSSHIWICTSPGLQVSFVSLFYLRKHQATSTTSDIRPNPMWIRQKESYESFVQWLSSVYSEPHPLPFGGVSFQSHSPHHALLQAVTGRADLNICTPAGTAGGIWSSLPSLLSPPPLHLQLLYAMLQ